MNEELEQRIRAIAKEFRYRYEGGGYFRDRTVPKGKRAEMRHGDEVIEELIETLVRQLA